MKELGILPIALIFVAISMSFASANQFDEILPCSKTMNARYDSLNTRFVGNWPFGYSLAAEYDSSRNLAYVGSGGGIYILDISVPSIPVKISENIHTRAPVLGLFYDEISQLLFVANSIAGLQIWDVSIPTNPQKIGSCDTPDIAIDVFISDTLVFIADWYGGLRIINISDPLNPYEMGYFDAPRIRAVHVVGSRAYIVSWLGHLMVIDVSSPSNPQQIDIWSRYPPFYDVYIQDQHLFLCRADRDDSIGVNVFDISSGMLRPIGFCETPDWPQRIKVCGDYAYVAANSDVSIIDASNPQNPQLVGYYYPCDAININAADSFVYVSCGYWRGLRILNAAQPDTPYLVGQFETPFTGSDVFVEDQYAYITFWRNDIRIIDISNLANPFEVGYCNIDGYPSSIFVKDSYAFVTDEDNSASIALRIIDVSDPANPFQIGICYSNIPKGWARGIFVRDSIACVAIRSMTSYERSRIWIVNVADPSYPQGLGYYITKKDAYDVFIVDSLAYLAATDFLIINISNPSSPQLIGCYEFENGRAQGVYVELPYAYIADALRLSVFDVSTPSQPQLVGWINTPGESKDCFVFDQFAYVADDTGGVRIIDVSNPGDLKEAGYYGFPINGEAVHPVGTFAFVADQSCGLQIFEFLGTGIEEEQKEAIPEPTDIRILQNPVTTTTVQLMITGNNSINCDIGLFNVLGQEVKSLNLENLSIGKNCINLSIDMIPNGVYFLKAKNDLSIPPEKVVILR